MRKWDWGIYLKGLEVARSQALIVEENCGRKSSDEHPHKIKFHLHKIRPNVRAGRDLKDT